MKLRYRFSLIILGLMLLAQGFYSGAYYYWERRSEMVETYQRAREAVHLTASVCHEAAVTGDWTPPKEHFKLLRGDSAVLYADCLDETGNALAHTDPRQVGVLQDIRATRAIEGIWVVSRSIRVPGRRFGLARIGYDATVLNRRIHDRLLRTLWLMARISSSTLLFGLLAALLIARTLTRPIEELAAATREISAGRLDYRLPDAGRRDELGVLSRRFNEMAERLDELNRMKVQIISSLTHDLKSPLASIKGCTEMMLADEIGDLTAKQRKYMKASLECSVRLWDYIDNILDVMRMQSGQYPVKIEPMEVERIVAAALKDQRPKAKECGIHLHVELEKNLPRVKADFELIRRALDNLVSNAVKFTPEKGAIKVRAGRDGKFVRFEVRDTGAGIPAEKLDRVFEDFYRVEETLELSRESGTGLGLTICERIVGEHGGRIWVESAFGEGSSFFFTLPAD